MSSIPVTFRHLHVLLLSEFPDIDSMVLRVNAEVITTHKPELARALERIITASPERDGRSRAVNYIKNMLIKTGTLFDDCNPSSGDLEADVLNEWSPNRSTDIVKLWNIRNLSQSLGLDYYDIYPDKDTVEWFHDHFLKDHFLPEDLYDDGHWHGIALLYLFSQNRDNYASLTPESVQAFIRWVRHHDDYTEVSRLCIERKTVDVGQLDALTEAFRGLAAPVRAGAL